MPPTTNRMIVKRTTTAESSHQREASQPKSPRLASTKPQITDQPQPMIYGPDKPFVDNLQRENRMLQEHNSSLASKLGASDRMIQRQHDAIQDAQQVHTDQSQQLYGAELRIGELEDQNAHNVAALQKQLQEMSQAAQHKLTEYQ